MSRPIPSTRGVAIPGVRITITRANIEDEQARRAEENRGSATPEQIVLEFMMPQLATNPKVQESKYFKRLVDRASRIMSSH